MTTATAAFPRRDQRPVFAGLIVAVAALALGSAFAVEHGLGIAPCELCLVERWPWRMLLLLGLLSLVRGLVGRAALLAATVVLLFSVGVGALHVGVENRLWPSPFPECRATPLRGGTVGDQLLAMPMRAAKPCDDPTFLVPGLPLSMAAMNLVLSLGLLGVVVMGLGRVPVRRR